jgi:hypothetical protein
LQDEVHADFDLTVVYVAGQSFAFTLNRLSFKGADWRKQINRDALDWQRYELPRSLEKAIQAFMDDASLEFGRLDFLLIDDVAHFLEVNPNGQWAWLDIDGAHGIFDAVIYELTKGWLERVDGTSTKNLISPEPQP